MICCRIFNLLSFYRQYFGFCDFYDELLIMVQASGHLVCQSCTLAGTNIMAISCIRVTRVAITEAGKLHALATTVLSVSCHLLLPILLIVVWRQRSPQNSNGSPPSGGQNTLLFCTPLPFPIHASFSPFLSCHLSMNLSILGNMLWCVWASTEP